MLEKDYRFVKEEGNALMLGNEAIVRGCLEAGVSYVSQYPGTPTSDIGEYFHQVLRENPEIKEYLVFTTNATQTCLENFESNLMINIFMLGFAIPTGKIPFIEVNHYEEVIKEWLRDPDLNIQALHLGLNEGKKKIRAKS